ncbi:MAG: zinc transporter ZntB [Myxococcales bacterium]|nr:MAG: zinc transporter ZntB [Myxococcales bacterium]
MSEHDGLICAYILDRDGGGHEIGWPEVADWTESQGLLWVHLNRSIATTCRWLIEKSGVPAHVAEALLAEDTRPRSATVSDGLLVNLRGVNLNPGADPEDMVSLRLYVERGRIISVRARRLLAIEDIRDSLARGAGPASEGEFLVRVAGRLVDRISPVIADLNDEVDGLETEVVTAESRDLQTALGPLRRQAISLRRYLAPQRDVLFRLHGEQNALLEPKDKYGFREIADQVTRYVEDLDAARERAAVIQEELQNRLAEHMNRTMFLLSLVAAVFLPLSFVTGLLGVNVAGIPGSEYPWAFAIVTALLVAVAAVQVWLFRSRKMI